MREALGMTMEHHQRSLKKFGFWIFFKPWNIFKNKQIGSRFKTKTRKTFPIINRNFS